RPPIPGIGARVRTGDARSSRSHVPGRRRAARRVRTSLTKLRSLMICGSGRSPGRKSLADGVQLSRGDAAPVAVVVAAWGEAGLVGEVHEAHEVAGGVVEGIRGSAEDRDLHFA